MIAALFDGPGQPFRFEKVSRPLLAPGEALVRLTLTTLCGSDLHTHSGRRTEPTPCVLGHEMVGIVEEFGPGELLDLEDNLIRTGDRVVWGVAVGCRKCFFCEHELPQKCTSLFKYGHARASGSQGPFGGLSTHCHLRAKTAIVKIPAELPDSVAAPAMCATSTAMAALRISRFQAGQSVHIFGGGLLGLNVAAIARSRGAGWVTLDDPDSDRLQQSREFGAEGTLSDHVRLTDGRGPDIVFEMSGSKVAIELALSAALVGGTVVLAGSVSPVGTVPLDPEKVVRRCLTIIGTHNYQPNDLLHAVRFLSSEAIRYPFARLVTAPFPLSEIDRAFAEAEATRPMRVAIAPNWV